VLTGPEVVEVAEVAEPTADPGTVVVAVDRCGIGGTDLEAYRTGRLPAPAWFGHEWSGRVVEIGDGVTGRFCGERVVGAVPPPCGRCRPCWAGLGDHCEEALGLIIGTHPTASPHGAFAERIRVDARRVHRVPDGVDDANAALAEPAAVAAHAVAQGDQRLGDLVVVVGAGTIGLLVAELARLAGAARVLAVDVEPGRRELACALGADAAVAPGDELIRWLAGQGHGLGADVVYECAGRIQAVDQSVGAVRHGGTVVLVGSPTGSPGIDPAALVARHLTVRASRGYTVADVHRALDLMADDRFRVAAIHERTVGFDRLPGALAELAGDLSARRKVLFAPAG
jgi:(R,R)-butanediol dehydrogenase/meso-butanediol dehydrogenase/diacetyl reductase